MLESYVINIRRWTNRKGQRVPAQYSVTIPKEIAGIFVERFGTEVQFEMKKDGLLIKPA
jgi:antitoxin component of MazEF toxin-antitoxin module